MSIGLPSGAWSRLSVTAGVATEGPEGAARRQDTDQTRRTGRVSPRFMEMNHEGHKDQKGFFVSLVSLVVPMPGYAVWVCSRKAIRVPECSAVAACAAIC